MVTLNHFPVFSVVTNLSCYEQTIYMISAPRLQFILPSSDAFARANKVRNAEARGGPRFSVRTHGLCTPLLHDQPLAGEERGPHIFTSVCQPSNPLSHRIPHTPSFHCSDLAPRRGSGFERILAFPRCVPFSSCHNSHLAPSAPGRTTPKSRFGNLHSQTFVT